MSKYQNKLIKYIESNPNFIQPEHRKNEIIGFLKKPLNDLCISRPKSRLSWGIELPFDKDYVTYVWFDALINYLTGIGFKKDKKLFEKYWPAILSFNWERYFNYSCNLLANYVNVIGNRTTKNYICSWLVAY